ncbi:MAG TPA: S8 family serine peptidase, partial [Puia sp.]|nr:S8 family serine peptidase [Puia sp.]
MTTKTLHTRPFAFAVLAVLFLHLSPATAQRIGKAQPGVVRLRNGTVPAFRNIADGTLRRDSLMTAHFRGHFYVLAQFDRLPDPNLRLDMAGSGLRLFDYVSDRAYLVEIGDSFSVDRLKDYRISGLFRLPAGSKISRRLEEHADEDLHNPDKLIAVGYFGNLQQTAMNEAIVATGAIIQPNKLQPPRVVFVRVANPGILQKLAALPFVSYIASQPLKPRALNYNNRGTHGPDELAATRNLYGDGVVVGVGDDTDPYTHVDFTGREIDRFDAPPGSGHGVHTSGIVGGGGILNPMWQGMAPHSTILSQFFSDILVNTPSYIADYDMPLTSNSYTDYDYGCEYDGLYDALANFTDAQLCAYPNLMHVFASGNDGGYTCSPYPLQFATIKSGFQCAKNALSVGNVDNTNGYHTNTYYINNGSSSGPTADGRLKPDLVAGGSAITSTLPNNTYGQGWGTSMSCPTVAGVLALMVQRYRQQHGGADPPAALLKALICNTATDMGNPGPDYIFGYGSLNGRAATDAMDAGQYSFGSVGDGGTINANLNIPSGLAQVRIMLYWTDYPAAPFAATALVNNLDLTVTDPSSVIHHPLILNPDPAHVNDNAREGIDSINNIEQVVLNNPAGGACNITIHGTGVPEGPQSYVLVYQFIQPSVVLEYPFGKDTWVPGNFEFIRWNVYDSSQNTFTLDYSTDNGATWTVINNAITPISRMYYWTTPNVATNQALMRVTRNGTSYSSVSTYPFTILGEPIVTVTNPCQGYAQLSWNAIPSATSYDIMQLVGDTMVKVAGTPGTSYLLGNLNRDSGYWLGVRAVIGASPGRRSYSVHLTPSGGACNLSALDNDYTVDSLIGVHSGRMNTSTQLTASTPIGVELRNLGTMPTGASFTLSYSINGGSPVTEICSAAVAPHNGAYDYTFSTPADFSAAGSYTLQVWVSYPGDPAPGNDTISAVIRQLVNDPVTLNPSFTEGFETAAAATYTSPVMGFTGLDRCDFGTSTANGRARTFVNTGMSHSGNRYAALDQSHYATTTTGDSLITTFNLSGYSTSDQIWLDFWYRNQGNIASLGGNKVWVRGNDQSPWIEAYILDTVGANTGVYQPSAHIDVTRLLTTASQTPGGSFQVRFGEEGYTSGNDVVTDGTLDNGYVFDDITLTRS